MNYYKRWKIYELNHYNNINLLYKSLKKVNNKIMNKLQKLDN